MHSPLSNSNNCSLLKKFSVSHLSNRWKSELGVDWLQPPGITEVEYWRDEETGLQFYSPGELAGNESLYSQLQHFSWYYMEEKWEFKAALKLLQTLPQDSQVLEIGVGQGAFLKKALDAGHLISGMELNPTGAQAAKEKGFTIIEQDIAALRADNPTTWDAICAFQVLEHLPEPRIFLDQAIGLLRTGGLLILSVPNAKVTSRLDPERTNLLDQPPHHMSHWTQEVFQAMATFLPLKLQNVMHEPLASYHIDWFVDAWTKSIQSQFGQTERKVVLNRITIPVIKKCLNLGLNKLVHGHTMLVCFQKF